MTHRGKIGHLPKAIQEELNVRLREGEKGARLVHWLNSLPEARSMLAAEFGGKAIREQNLSEWRRYGHQKWLREQEARELMKQAGTGGQEPAGTDNSTPDQHMAAWLTAHYLAAVRRLEGGTGRDEWNRLRECCRDLVALRRSELRAQRLEFERDKLAAATSKKINFSPPEKIMK